MPTLNLLKVREEFCHRSLQTTKAQTSLRICAVWSAPLLFTNWIVSYLNLLQARLHYFYLVSVAEKAGFRYDLIGNPEDKFCRIDAHICIYIHVNADPIHKPVSCDMHIENCLAPLDYSWPILPMTNADGICTKDNTPSPSAPLNTPFCSGKGVGIKRTFFI